MFESFLKLNLPTKIAVIFILSLIALPFIIYLMRWLKGNAKILLDRINFKLGEKVEGSFVINSKKILKADRVTVSLLCFLHHTNRKKQSTRGLLIYQDKKIISQNMRLRRGKTILPFSIEIPNEHPEYKGINITDSLSDLGLESNAEMINGFATKLIGRQRPEWQIFCEVEMEGINFEVTERVFVK